MLELNVEDNMDEKFQKQTQSAAEDCARWSKAPEQASKRALKLNTDKVKTELSRVCGVRVEM